MLHCSHCHRVTEPYVEQCPNCSCMVFYDSKAEGVGIGTASDAEATNSLVAGMIPIARFASAAEAGFFAHELVHQHEIATDVQIEEDFDALGGFWSTRYVLAVAEGLQDQAGRLLDEMIQIDHTNEIASASTISSDLPHASSTPFNTSEVDDYETETSHEGGINWIPIVLTLTAGSAALWVVRSLNEQPQPMRAAEKHGQSIHDLFEQLGQSSEPWVQKLNGGRGRRELYIDRNGDRIMLREDANGDGLFERELEFQE